MASKDFKNYFNISMVIKLLLVCIFIYYTPLWRKKYPFSKEEKCWMTTYDVGDSLLFTDFADVDTIVITDKVIKHPRNRFGFDWEGWNIFMLFNISDEFPALVIYRFETFHGNRKTRTFIKVEKSDKNGVNIDSSFGGLDFMLWHKKFDQTDTISADLSMCKLVINKDMHIPDFWGYKLTPKDGLIEYSFIDGRIYKFIKRIPVKSITTD